MMTIEVARLEDRQCSCGDSALSPTQQGGALSKGRRLLDTIRQPSGLDRKTTKTKMPEQLSFYLTGGEPWWLERIVSESDKKTFDHSCHDKYDDRAKQVLKNHLQCCGIQTTINDDQYGIDLLGIDANYEVEVKKDWRGNKFPYKTIHVPARKRKLLSGRSIFVILNNDLTMGCYIPSSAMSNTIRKDTRVGTVREEFFEVPLSTVTFFPVQAQGQKHLSIDAPFVAQQSPPTLWSEITPQA